MNIFVRAMIGCALVCVSCSSSNSLSIRDGTSDSGGGNGVDNKVYERYIVHPENLPVFQQFLAPKLQQLAMLAPHPELVIPVIKRWTLYKTWYIAPVKLDT